MMDEVDLLNIKKKIEELAIWQDGPQFDEPSNARLT